MSGSKSTPGTESVFHSITPQLLGFYLEGTLILAHNALGIYAKFHRNI
jgi:hypothetical protein